MPSRVFLLSLVSLIILTIVTSPPLVRPFLQREPTPTATTTTTPIPATATPTTDPFANIPTATPAGSRSGIIIATLPGSDLKVLPPAFPSTASLTPISALTPTVSLSPPSSLTTPSPFQLLLPDSQTTPPTDVYSLTLSAARPPDRLHIPKIALNVSLEPVGLAPLDADTAAPVLPAPPIAGWVTTSAGFGLPGNIVLVGRPSVLRDLWTLQAGDAITLHAGRQTRTYIIHDIVALPDQDQPRAIRLANGHYLQATAEDQLTIVTAHPTDSVQIIVIARLQAKPD